MKGNFFRFSKGFFNNIKKNLFKSKSFTDVLTLVDLF